MRALLIALSLVIATPVLAGDAEDIQQLLKARQFSQALERANKAVAAKPKDVQLRFLQALALTESGRTDDAIRAFTQIAEENPGLPEPYNNLAVLYAQQNQLDKARTALQLAIQTNPSYAIAHENMGDLYARLASQSYDRALQLESGNSKVQTKLTLVRDLFSRSNPGVRPGTRPLAALTAPPAAKPVTAPPAVKPVTPPPATKPATPPPAAKPATPPPAAKPSTPPPAAKPAVPDREAETRRVLQALDRWAGAWSRQNVDGYLASYSRNFRPPKGARFADWARERRERITAPSSISVKLSSQRVEFIDDNTVRVRVRQSYSSNRLDTTTGKTFVLERSGSTWLIVEERAG